MVSRGVVSVGKRCGGAELVAFELAGHLANGGEDVILVADVDSPMLEQAPEGLSISQVGSFPGLGWLASRMPMEFPRWVLQHLLGNIRAAWRARVVLETDAAGFDVVHVHGALAAILLSRTIRVRARRIPLVYTEHDSTPWSCRYRRRSERAVRRCVYRLVNLRACRSATVVVTNFPALADELAVRAGIPRSRFITVRNVTEARAHSDRYRAESVKVRHGFDRYCLFVGSLIDRKGPDILLRALAEVSLPCIFVGDGPMRSSLERLAIRAGITDRVVFTGALEHSDVSWYYSAAEALVLPSVSEGVPLVALEALRAGVPVVASNLTGIASVVRHRENGLLVDPGNEASLARALALLENDDTLRDGLRQGAKRTGLANGSWSDVVNELRTLYAQSRPLPAVPRQREGRRELGAAAGLAAAGLALGFSPAVVTLQPELSTHA